jgi:hypothetical protein
LALAAVTLGTSGAAFAAPVSPSHSPAALVSSRTAEATQVDTVLPASSEAGALQLSLTGEGLAQVTGVDFIDAAGNHAPANMNGFAILSNSRLVMRSGAYSVGLGHIVLSLIGGKSLSVSYQITQPK